MNTTPLYQPNQLDIYDTYTYEINVYVVHPQNLHLGEDALQKPNGTTLLMSTADNGYGYNISDLEHVFSMGYGNVRHAVASYFRMTVLEPNGCSLLSRIKLICNDMGISNHLQAGYLITVGFNGRNDSGNSVAYSPKFSYSVRIVNFDFIVEAGGSQYTIELVDGNASGYNGSTNVIKSQITIVASTFGDFVKQFNAKMRKTLRAQWAADPQGGRYYDDISIAFDESTESWGRWEFQALKEPFSSSAINFIGIPSEQPELQINITNGSQIPDIISQVLQLTKEYKQIVAAQGKTTTYLRESPSENVSDLGLADLPVFFKSLPEVVDLAFDELTNRYQKRVTHYIHAFKVPTQIIEPLSYQAGIYNNATQQKRVKNIIENKLLRKRYDYIFTGNNTDVLDLEMKFNHAYFTITPLAGGNWGESAITEPKTANDLDNISARVQAIQKARERLVDSQRALEERREQLANETTTATPAPSIRLGETVDSLEQTVVAEEESFSNVYDENFDFLRQRYGLGEGDAAFLSRFNADVVSEDDFTSSDNDTKAGSLKMGAVRANLESSADMVEIDLGVKGDPYWIGMPNSPKYFNSTQDDIVNYMNGYPGFFLNVNLPVDENANGQRLPSPDFQLTGIYFVTGVINRFNSGQFTQRLTGHRDVSTNTSRVYTMLKNDSATLEGVNRAILNQNVIDLSQQMENAYRRNALGE